MSSKMKSEIDSLRQENASLMAKITALESGKDELLKHGRENQGSRAEVVKLRDDNEENERQILDISPKENITSTTPNERGVSWKF
ncbi:16628_t:CDS:2 [Rhizophagus irregularis]|nr:16628_t:CDS:2 [Rhizophagus irregularis]